MLRVTALPPEAFRRLEPPKPSPKFEEMASKFLPRAPWAANAPFRHRDNDTFLYCRDYLLGNEKRSVSLTPFAVVMAESVLEGEEQVPITMVAESAQIDFSGSLGDADFDVGQVTSGQLQGQVRIEGPDNMLIIGRNFSVNESARRLWSEDIVQFRYGPHAGRGRGVEIRLASGDMSDGALAAESIRTVRILEDVVLELLGEGDVRTRATPAKDIIHVKSKGHLEFDLETNIATLETDIEVRKPTSPTANDTLKCDMLNIHFRKVEEVGSKKNSQRLEPIQLTAKGGVELQSQENELFVTQVTDLNYLLEERVIELANSASFASGVGPPMKVAQQSSDMICRRLILVHDEANQLRAIRCPGPGVLNSKSEEKPDELALVARWSDGLVMEPEGPDGMKILQISGQALVQQPTEKTQLSADTIRVWLREQPVAATPAAPSAPKIRPSTSAFARTRLTPIKMEADGNVDIKSPQMSGPTKHLVVLFDEPTAVANRSGSRRKFKPASFRSSGSQDKTRARLMDRTFNVQAETIQAVVRAEPAEGQSEMPEVHLKGRVVVRSVDRGERMLLEGDALHVLEDESGSQTMELIGSAQKLAIVEHDHRQIEGLSIYLDRAANKAEVIGAGSLKVMVDKDLEGRSLPDPEPLEIVWTKEMAFDGRQATLQGNVTARLGNDEIQRQELICPVMRVHFTEVISFSEGLNGGNEAELGKLLNNIECLGGVTVNSFEFSQGRTMEERHARFRSVDINQKTGNTKAVGPGWITSWTQDRPRLSRAVSAKANQSLEARKSAWNYTRIDFLGILDGNYHRRTTTFKRDVTVVYGPVERLSQVVDPDASSDGELPEGAIRMKCDQLQLTERGAKKGQRTMELLGFGNAELDGRKVHAEADEIKYDEYKELFTLLSKGDRMAKIWQRDRVGAPWRGFSGRRWVYSQRNESLQGSSITGGSSGL
jgi:hypothetical protein